MPCPTPSLQQVEVNVTAGPRLHLNNRISKFKIDMLLPAFEFRRPTVISFYQLWTFGTTIVRCKAMGKCFHLKVSIWAVTSSLLIS